MVHLLRLQIVMKFSTLLLLLCITAMCQAQTKVIAHKSHSGSSKTFMKAYKENLFDINCSNFGLPGNKNIYVLDTIEAINDTMTVLKMRESNVCFPFPYETKYSDLKEADFTSKNDTLINHEVFTRRNTVAFIKSKATYLILFSNPIEEVVFVGFKE